MPITENRSESPAGLNWTPQILRTGTDSRARSSFAGRARVTAEKLQAIDQELARQLKAAIDLVVRDTVIVTFGGRFNSGKSTLLNRLLRRQILPMNVEAETGAPCFIRAAARDRASAFQQNRLVEIPCNTESLRDQLSLWRRTIGETETELAARVEIDLANVPVPSQVRWVDTPGVDESNAMDDASLEVFRHTDVLIWVLSSEAALSIQEMEYVRNYIEEAGPRGVLFVTNVFIRDSSTYEEGWQTFLSHQLPVLCSRINQNAEDMCFDGYPPRMLSVCGAAIGRTTNGGYGATSVDELVRSIASPDHVLVTASRLQRVSRSLERTAEVLDERWQQIAVQSDRTEKDREEWERTTGGRRAQFERRVSAAVEALAAEYLNAVNNAGRTVAASVSSANIRRDGTYSRYLYNQLLEAMNKTTAVCAEAVKEAGREAGLVCVAGDILAAVRREIPQPAINVFVPNTPKKSGGAMAALAIGFFLAFFTAGIAFLIAIFLAYFLLKGEGDKARAADVAGTKWSIGQEATRAAQQIAAWKMAVQNTTLRMYQPAGAVPGKANRATEQSLANLAQELRILATEADELATASV